MSQKMKKLRDKWLLIGAALIAAFGIAACGGGGSSAPPAPPVEAGEAVQLNSVLSGNQISAASGGPIATNAGGTGIVIVSADRASIDFTLDAGPLGNFNSPIITGAHIHVRDAGSDNGPIIFNFDPAAPIPDPLVISGTLTADNLIPRPASNVPDFAAAVEALLNGMTYFQVHTQAHLPGEIRGHIGPEFLTSTLDGAQVPPSVGGPVITNATGSGELMINSTQDAVSVLLDLGLTADFNGTIVAAHIHFGASGVEGPIIFDFALPAVIPANLVINVVLTADDLLLQQTIASFTEAVDALLSGNTYFQVHTDAHPGGELRGQIFPVRE